MRISHPGGSSGRLSQTVQVHCCQAVSLGRWSVRQARRPWWRVYWNVEAGAVIRHHGEQLPLLPTEMMLIAPETDFSVQLKQSLRHHYLHCNFGRPLDGLQDRVLRHPLRAEDRRLWRRVARLAASTESVAYRQALMQLLGLVVAAIPVRELGDAGQLTRMEPVCAVLDAEPGRRWSNPELAGLVGMATNAFIRSFTRELGEAPQRYLRRRRLELACVLLEHEDLSIDSIAEHCGFAHRAHFANVFKRALGTAPAAWRRQARG